MTMIMIGITTTRFLQTKERRGALTESGRLFLLLRREHRLKSVPLVL
jgi:hypothetical protein